MRDAAMTPARAHSELHIQLLPVAMHFSIGPNAIEVWAILSSYGADPLYPRGRTLAVPQYVAQARLRHSDSRRHGPSFAGVTEGSDLTRPSHRLLAHGQSIPEPDIVLAASIKGHRLCHFLSASGQEVSPTFGSTRLSTLPPFSA